MWQHDDWGGMSLEEAMLFAVNNIENGNLTDAIGFMMRDGDVRIDCVKLVLRVAAELQLRQIRSATTITNHLIRLIDTWETT